MLAGWNEYRSAENSPFTLDSGNQNFIGFLVNRAVATDQTLLAALDHVVDIGCIDE